jgi:hypothetical protein
MNIKKKKKIQKENRTWEVQKCLAGERTKIQLERMI